MITNKKFRLAVSALVIFSMGLSAPAFALSGSVIYGPGTGTLITRAVTAPAITPELNQTYQRTMRRAATQAAVANASVKLIRGFAGSLLTIGTLVTLASDVHGIWKKTDGRNDLEVPSKVSQCSPTASEIAEMKYYRDNIDASYTLALVPESDSFCVYQRSGNGGGIVNYLRVSRTTVVDPTKTMLLTDDDLQTKLLEPGRLIPIIKELDDLGSPVDFPGPDIEDMPQPIPITPITTTNPDGSKTIQQTTLEPYRSTPDGPVQWRKKDVITEISAPAPDGTTTTKTSTTTTDKGQQSTAEKAPEAPATDTALPAQPKLYTKKYPDGMTGVWRDQRSAMANSPLFTLPRMLMPSSVGSGGSCPAMNVNLTFSQWANFGTKDIAPPCYVWDWGKAICIVSACLLARRLIFGG